jgi:hypothetical protein
MLAFSPEPSVSHLLLKNVKKKKAIILPVVLYGCETWSLTLKEEHRLKAFENRLLRKITVPRKVEKAGLCDLYSSPSIIRIIKSRMR